MGEPATFIDINDFSPGIVGDRHGFTGPSSTSNPNNSSTVGLNGNGAATIDDTFGCAVDPTGALVPLPGRALIDQTPWQQFAEAAHVGTNYFPAGKLGYYLLDARVMPYTVTDTHNAGTERDSLFLTFGAFYDPGNTGAYRQLVWSVIAGINQTMWGTVHWSRYAPGVSPSPATSIPSSNVAVTRQVDGNRDANGFLRYGVQFTQNSMWFMVAPSRDGTVGNDETGWADGSIPANELALTNYQGTTGRNTYPDSNDGLIDGVVGIFPDPRDLDTFSPRYMSGMITGYMAIAHQGRIIIASLLSRGYGPGFNAIVDRVAFSPIYNSALNGSLVAPTTTMGPPDYTSSIAGDDVVSPIGTLGSIQASELIVIKHGRGGVLMRGDMDNFEAVSLPYIESTYGIVSHGVGTPIGWVYGSRNGVFVWSGGDTSEKLSKQIEGYFWNHASNQIYAGNQGRFDYWHPWVCVPNDYIMDINSKSWWKLEDSSDTSRSTYNIYQVSALNGRLYAFEHRMAPGAKPVIYSYDPEVLRPGYSWKSQPLIETRDRMMAVQDIEITFTNQVPYGGSHTFAITFFGFDELGDQIESSTQTLTPNATPEGGTQVLRTHKINGTGAFVARYVQVRIVVAGGATGPTTPAPKIHQIRIGITDRNRTPNRDSA